MSWALKYIGLPFKDRGRGLDGCDCWGLVRLIYGVEFGVALPDYLDAYPSCHARGAVAQAVADGAEGWAEVPPGAERAGDGVLLRMAGLPTHVGVVVERGRMLHIHEGIDAVIEDYRRPAWRARVLGFFRHAQMPGVRA